MVGAARNRTSRRKQTATSNASRVSGSLVVLAAALPSSGCATTPPLDATETWTGLEPCQIGNEPQFDEELVPGGGMIVAVENRERSAEVTVLAYPLDDRQQPRLGAASERRFIAAMPGFVEPLEYPQGRFVTLRGRMFGTRAGTIQQREYLFPLVRVQAAHVWPRDFRNAGPDFSIGIGISGRPAASGKDLASVFRSSRNVGPAALLAML
jgi:outer membrane lipoprotein